MSYSTIMAVWPGDRAEDILELRNAWGTAPYVWNEMSMKYLNFKSGGWLFNEKQLWPLYNRPDIPFNHRAILTMTYDNAYVLKKDFKRAGNDIRAFLADFPPNDLSANHWDLIAKIFESDPDFPAIGFYWTSVSEDPYIGEYDEENGKYLPPDWSKFWDMYSELETLQGSHS